MFSYNWWYDDLRLRIARANTKALLKIHHEPKLQPFATYETKTAALIRGNVQLDERKIRRCGRCDGIGSLVVRRRVVDCDVCGGKGVVIG